MYLIKKNTFLLVVMFLLMAGCKSRMSIDIQRLCFPEDLTLMTYGEGLDTINSRPLTLINKEYCLSVWINGDCLPCILEMANWHTIYYRFALPYNIAMNFYVYSQYDYSLFEETMQNTLFSSLPVYYDKNNEFLKTNNLKMGEDDCFFTKGDTIILKGNIVRDRKVYREFEQKLKGLEMVYDVSFFGFK